MGPFVLGSGAERQLRFCPTERPPRRRLAVPSVPSQEVWMSSRFETVAQAEREARRRLPKAVLSSLQGGREQGLSLRDNRTAFGELALMPTAFDKPATVDPSTSFLGQPLSFPAIVSPLGALGL